MPLSRVKSATAFYGYRLLARFAEVIPAKAVGPLAAFAAWIGARTNPERRQMIERHSRRTTGETPSSKQLEAIYASYVRYWLMAFRLPVLSTERLDAMLEVDGLERLQTALVTGKGVIFGLPHVGNWDVAGAWISARGVPLTVVVEAVEPPELFRWFTGFRESLGVRVVSNSPGVAGELTGALRRNEVVALLCDRDVDGTGGTYEFFGETTRLPRGPATLALRTGATLLPIAVYEQGDTFRAVIDEPVAVERLGTLREDIDRVTQELTYRVEALIKRAPEQWHLFQPNWPSDY